MKGVRRIFGFGNATTEGAKYGLGDKNGSEVSEERGSYPLTHHTDLLTDTMETITATIPTTIPYEDDHYKWNYDDCGVICRYDKETEEWEPMEPHCVDCGHRDDECDCEEEERMWELCEHCGGHEEDNALFQGNTGEFTGKWICRPCVAKDDELESLTQRPQTRATTKKIAELLRMGLA